jgi:putative salt-induced outer membrane protein YdiY
VPRILGTLIVVLAAAASPAQEPPSSPSTGWQGEAGLSYVQTGGNSDTQTFGVAGKLLHTGKWSGEASGSLLRTESDDEVTAKKWNGLLRGTRLVRPRLRVLAQTTFLRDLFAGIERETAFDGGVQVELLGGERETLSASLSLAAAHEDRIAPAADRTFLGMRTGVSWRRALGSGSEILAEGNYLRGLDDPRASRAQTSLAVTSSIARVFALKVAHRLLWLQSPVPGKKAADTELVASLVARWPGGR